MPQILLRRLADCSTRDSDKLSTIQPDDSDFIYDLRIKNINAGYFDNEEGFRHHNAIHLDSDLSSAMSHTLIGRWRFTLDGAKVLHNSYYLLLVCFGGLIFTLVELALLHNDDQCGVESNSNGAFTKHSILRS